MKWILLSFLFGCILASMIGCRSTQKLKITTDIPGVGKPSYHVEYVREF